VSAEFRLDKQATTLEVITPDLTRPAMVRVADAPQLGALREYTSINPKTYFKDFDYVIDYPVRK
jgi:hypothetical protein